MSEYCFGVTREKLSQREVARRDKIAKAVAGPLAGYDQINDPGEGWSGWFSVPNRGMPFDLQVQREIEERLEA